MYWPGSDPFWDYNQTENEARRSYYNVSFVPILFIDGSQAPLDYSGWGSAILSEANVSAPISLAVNGGFDWNSRTGYARVSIYTENTVTGNFVAHLVLIEDDLYYNGGNGHPVHNHVMRRMLLGASGLPITLTQSDTTEVEINFDIDDEILPENCRLVAFVQNSSTKNILNACQITLEELGPINIPNLYVVSRNISVLNDDGDGKLNPGETAELTITIGNECDWQDAHNVQAVLHTDSPYVTIQDSTADYDEIIACDEVLNQNDPFRLSVAANAPLVAELPFTLEVTSTLANGDIYRQNFSFNLTMDLFQAGFPFPMTHGSSGGNAVIDIDGDGEKEVIFAAEDSSVHVLNSHGQEKTGFPFRAANRFNATPAVGDLQNDGVLEILAPSKDHNLYLISPTGEATILYTSEGYLLATPTLVDLNGDGALEIILPEYQYQLNVLTPEGTSLPGFPVVLENEHLTKGAAVADINGDGEREIIVGTLGHKLHAFTISGTELNGFPLEFNSSFMAAPTCVDLTGDGVPEILAPCDDGFLYAIDGSGNILWSTGVSGQRVRTSPAVGHGADGQLIIYFGSYDNALHAVTVTGDTVAGWPQYTQNNLLSSPATGDIDGDGVDEVFVGSDDHRLYGFRADGSALDGFPLELPGRVRGAPTIADLDQDGNPEIIVANDYSLVAVDIKTTQGNLNTGWPTYRGNYRRTGYYSGSATNLANQRPHPVTLHVSQPYPNPANPISRLEFTLPYSSRVEIAVFDLQGRNIYLRQLGLLPAGDHTFQWNGEKNDGQIISSGVYLVRIQAGDFVKSRKLLMIR